MAYDSSHDSPTTIYFVWTMPIALYGQQGMQNLKHTHFQLVITQIFKECFKRTVYTEIRASAPIDKFGIVAAVSKNGIIGIDNIIPWRVPQDRQIFKTLTNGSIMIIGKRTFQENPMLQHINHSRCCIVVSTSMLTIDSNLTQAQAPNTRLKLARSFSEALVMAEEVRYQMKIEEDFGNKNGLTSDISCWIAGGQALYQEALLHESAYEIHLSIINTQVPVNTSSLEKGTMAMFPPQNLWDRFFEEVANVPYPQDGDIPSFSYHVFRRKGGGLKPCIERKQSNPSTPLNVTRQEGKPCS